MRLHRVVVVGVGSRWLLVTGAHAVVIVAVIHKTRVHCGSGIGWYGMVVLWVKETIRQSCKSVKEGGQLDFVKKPRSQKKARFVPQPSTWEPPPRVKTDKQTIPYFPND